MKYFGIFVYLIFQPLQQQKWENDKNSYELFWNSLILYV